MKFSRTRMFFLAVSALLLIASGSCKLTTRNSDLLDNLLPVLIPAERVDHYERDVVYAVVDGHDLTLDVSWPDSDQPLPVVVWVHGGNYNHFSKESGEGLARYLTNRGFVVMNINYRKVPEAHLKQIIEDVMGATLWAKDHAQEYGGDPKLLALAGHSSGAQMVEVVALACRDDYFDPSYKSVKRNDACPAALIPVSGYFEFEQRWGNWNPWLLGVERSEDPELYARCEPMSYDLTGQPPHLIVFGDRDMHRARGEQWVAKLRDAGVEVETYMAHDAEHHWIMWHWKRNARDTYDAMAGYLSRRLGSGGTVPAQELTPG